ncbi:translation initiation factor IF-2 [Candidatus Saccharibacteria bacterium QS_5_54_17]|nr:MAG: translation initiation factor IF-2 [Candidatus Saccharibacteria bacterium QS_5_54_17]
MDKQVAIQTPITVADFAQALDMKVTDVIAELMKNGVMATINDTIDFETAAIVAEDLGVAVTEDEAPASAEESTPQTSQLASGEGESRPPVVTVMGHVDHGKTTLLDGLRQSDTAAGEAGGITQHISAYQIQHNERTITFLDTPGHEAFSALREHGARLTDVAIIVVAADDGVQPQTKEAIQFARDEGVRVVVAINKVDLPGADTNRVKQQLADEEVLPEEWGGETVTVEISAQKQQNLDTLLDMVLLVADVADIRARYDGPAEGMIIESQLVKGQGVTATVLVRHGELNVGDYLVAEDAYARIRSLEDFTGARLERAGPAMPVAVTGWKAAPRLAAVAVEYPDEKSARKAAGSTRDEGSGKSDITQPEALTAAMREGQKFHVPVIIKADVEGSLNAVQQSLERLKTDEVQVEIVGSGIGPVSESDVTLAESTGARIIGFGVSAPGRIKQLASRAGITIQVHTVIYELIEAVREEMSSVLEPEVIEEEWGTLQVRGVFKIAQKELICGGQVTAGKIKPELHVRYQAGEEVGTVKSVQREQQSAKEVVEGEMCGLNITTERKVKVAEGDVLEFVARETRQRSA